MKKLVPLLLVVLFIFCFAGCNKLEETTICNSCGTKNEITAKYCSNCSALLVEDNTTTEKTAKEKLCEYIKTNGANYQGVFKIIELKESSYTTISSTTEDNITFYYYFEGNYNECYVELDFYEESVTQSVIYKYEQQGYTCIVNGILFTELVNADNCTLYSITYRENFPSSVSEGTIEKIVATCHTATKSMLASINAMLIKYVGIELKTLGFKSW